MFKIKLTFCSGNTVELFRVDCSLGGAAPLTSVRGRTTGAYRGVGTFNWSSAVRAMACLFLKAKLIDENDRVEPLLIGGAGSLAVSLDYALTKRPVWLVDMFGESENGRILARRLFRVTNSHRKRSGPVAISLNSHTCPQHCVEIVLDGTIVSSSETLGAMLARIEADELAARSSDKGHAPDKGEEAPVSATWSPTPNVVAA
jgi:hypothetical protein